MRIAAVVLLVLLSFSPMSALGQSSSSGGAVSRGADRIAQALRDAAERRRQQDLIELEKMRAESDRNLSEAQAERARAQAEAARALAAAAVAKSTGKEKGETEAKMWDAMVELLRIEYETTPEYAQLREWHAQIQDRVGQEAASQFWRSVQVNFDEYVNRRFAQLAPNP